MKHHDFTDIGGKILAERVFLREFLRAPSQVGSICPSSKALVSTLAKVALDANDSNTHGDSLIIDLGAGSGIVTEKFLEIGVKPARIMAVDISGNFAKIFGDRCRGVELNIGDARFLNQMIAQSRPGDKICAIVSSLPLRVMPPETVARVMSEARLALMARGGVFVQYTYAFWKRRSLRKYGFIPLASQFVPKNIPPALVEVYAPVMRKPC